VGYVPDAGEIAGAGAESGVGFVVVIGTQNRDVRCEGSFGRGNTGRSGDGRPS